VDILTAIVDWAQRSNSLWWALAAVVGIPSLFAVFLFVVSPSLLKPRMGGRQILDIRPYTAEQAHAALEAYGQTGRVAYLVYLAADLVTPLVYGALLALAAGFAADQCGFSPTVTSVVILLPIAAGVLDWGENISLAILTLAFPNLIALGWLAATFTVAKLAAFGVAFAVGLVGLVCALLGI
jgi:hypothetical protein